MPSPATGRSAFVGLGVEQQIPGSMIGAPNPDAAPNYGLQFDPIEPGKWFTREDSRLKTTELSGRALEPASYPGPATFPGEIARDFRLGSSIIPTATLTGKPTITHPGAVVAAAAPVITHGGTPGTTHMGYKVVCFNADGLHTEASAAGSTTTAAATLDDTDYNIVTPIFPAGTVTWDVRRVEAAGTPSTLGKLNSTPLPVATTFYHDIGGAGDASTAPATNATHVISDYSFPFSDRSADSVSAWALVEPGGDFLPVISMGQKFSSVEIDTAAKQLGLKISGQGIGSTECAIGVPDEGNTGTGVKAPITKGPRRDAGGAEPTYLSKTVYVEIVDAAAAGTFTVKAKLCAPADEGTTSVGGAGTLVTCYYDTVTKKMIPGGANDDPVGFVELMDQAGVLLGMDDGENRESFCWYLPGDVTVWLAGDKWAHAPTMLIPGAGSDPFTGVVRLGDTGQVFTPAHVKLMKGSSSASDFFAFDSLTVKLASSLAITRQPGPGWKRPGYVDVSGFLAATFDIDRRYITREFERAMETNTKFFVDAMIEGSRIPITVGGVSTFSTYREKFWLRGAQVVVTKTDAPPTGPTITHEKLTFTFEAPADGSVGIALNIVSGAVVDFTA
jgi:hypothetical protein